MFCNVFNSIIHETTDNMEVTQDSYHENEYDVYIYRCNHN